VERKFDHQLFNITHEIMNQRQNENRNDQNEEESNQKTNQERGNNDLNPTDRNERDIQREFELDDDKERNLEVTSKTIDPGKDRNNDEKSTDRIVPSHEDPNVNAEKENQRKNLGTMTNQPRTGG
jgi:hypothetical protein